MAAGKLALKYLRSTRHSIFLEWDDEEEGRTYTVQVEDPAYGWITKYWGYETSVEIKELGPEELYTIRVGASRKTAEGKWTQNIWSDAILSATNLYLPWTFYLFQYVQENAASDVVTFSKERASCLDVYNKYGDTPLTLAIREQKDDVVQSLLDNGADANQPAKTLRKTPLMVACFGGYKAAADALVNRGVDWNMIDSNKCQALHYAVDGCQLEMVRYGIERGADVNAQDKFGWTPLMRGVLIGCKSAIISLLIENGCDVNLRDQNKMRALDLAKLLGCADLVELLDKHTEHEQELTEEPEKEDPYCGEEEENIEAKREETEEAEGTELMRKIDSILGLPVEDDKLMEEVPDPESTDSIMGRERLMYSPDM